MSTAKEWSKQDIGTAGRMIARAVTLTAGYAAAAQELGRTPTSVRLAHERGTLGEVQAKGGQTQDELKARRERDRVKALEQSNERLLKDLAELQDQYQTATALGSAKARAVQPAKRGPSGTRQGVPVLLCSDWHVEERVDPATVNGANEYNLDIAAKCIDALADAYAWMLSDTRYDCRTGVVALLGDLYSGHIHDELLESNFLSPVEAAVFLLDHVEAMLRKIGATTKLERIIVVCNDGNHGRLTHKIRISTRTKNSLEWLIYKQLAARMKDDPRFEFQIADGEWNYLDVYGRTLAFTHGDSFKYGGGVGGISIPIERGIARMHQGRDIHVTSMGHFHQRKDFGNIVVNGSMIGHSPYAERIHAKPEPRQQSFFMVDSVHGKCISAPVWLPNTSNRKTPRKAA